MFIALLVIIGLSLLILGHEAGHFFVAKRLGLKVDEFGFGFPPRIFAKKIGETEYSLNWLPFGGFVRIAGENDRINGETETLKTLPDAEKRRLFLFQPAWRRALVTIAGVAVNFILGWLLISIVLMIGTPRLLVVGDVQKGSPAEAVGVKPGDVIRNYTESQSFIGFINAHRGEAVQIELRRGDEYLKLTVVPRRITQPNEGALGVILSEGGEARHGFFGALYEGLKRALLLSWWTFGGLYALIKNLVVHGSLLAGVVGPVGIFSIAAQTGKLGLIYIVQLVSLISINLAVINLIPFPALDGGRLLLILIEKIKGSPISVKTEAWVNGAGFVFLIALMLLITIRDITRWF